MKKQKKGQKVKTCIKSPDFYVLRESEMRRASIE